MEYRCIACFRKHISACKSFGRQILDGHGQGGIPDHRIDFEGQLVNAQYHSQLIDNILLRKIRLFRRLLQRKKFHIEQCDLQVLDTLYYYSFKFQNQYVNQSIINSYQQLQYSDKFSNITTNTPKQGCGCANAK